jgi:hypothetical protein
MLELAEIQNDTEPYPGEWNNSWFIWKQASSSSGLPNSLTFSFLKNDGISFPHQVPGIIIHPSPLSLHIDDVGNDADLASGGNLVIGETTGPNMAIDTNEIVARNAGGANTLYIQSPNGSGNTIINTRTGNVGIGVSTPDGEPALTHKLEVDDGDINIRAGGLRIAGTCDRGPCASDLRLKKNLERIDNALDKLILLEPARFEFKDAKHGNGIQYGLIAQEVEPVFPEIVSVDKDGYLHIDYGRQLEMYMLQAIRELKEEKDEEIEELRLQNKALQEIICELKPDAEICE